MATPNEHDQLGVRRPERETLVGFLDWYRDVAIAKVDGLSLDQASKAMTSSGLSALGIVKHLTWAERLWFRFRFSGEDIDVETGGDNTPTFVVDPDDTVDGVVVAYREECERSRAIVAAASLDDVAAREHRIYGHTSLRWIVVHLIEETARHAGHLDLIREQLDGKTGD
jgi:hypothetical protein